MCNCGDEHCLRCTSEGDFTSKRKQLDPNKVIDWVISLPCHYCGSLVSFSKDFWEKNEIIRKRPMHEHCILAKWA